MLLRLSRYTGPAEAQSARPPLCFSCYAQLAAGRLLSALRAAPVEIRGVRGEFAELVVGVYEPTAERRGGRVVYRKRGDPDKWLSYVASQEAAPRHAPPFGVVCPLRPLGPCVPAWLRRCVPASLPVRSI